MPKRQADPFYWGAASAAHQVEGNNRRNQWWAFENGVGTASGERSGISSDHYRRFADDFRTLKKLGHNAHRISFEWSRFFPDGPTSVDKGAVRHYRRVIDTLKRLHLEPFVTIFHFTIPEWFAQQGGFADARNLVYFDDFAALLAREFSDVRYWCTINEPMVYALQSYITRDFPPAQTDVFSCLRVIRNLLFAHARCYRILKAENPSCMVGPVQHCTCMEPVHRHNPLDVAAAKGIDWFFNYMYLDALSTGMLPPPLALFSRDTSIPGTADFIGINYYTRLYIGAFSITGRFAKRPDEQRTLMGWTEYPEGISHFITSITERYKLPVIIAENGIATDDDAWRSAFIERHVSRVMEARTNGADVRAYFHWSNLDNFEWQRGFSPHFGLISVAKDGKRHIKKSAFAYRDLMTRLLKKSFRPSSRA
ncbi:MAG: glycoside hydrolase family 1 protein [Spirochaetota bacterium]